MLSANPASPAAPRRVALYWDFDNVVLSRFDAVHGRNSWSQARYLPRSPADGAKERMREARVDLGVVMDYAATLGSVVINRAYGNWTPWWMVDYSRDLLQHAIDLVQLFPLSGTKNGADIRLAVDVVEDLHQHLDITDVLVVAGDSDYVGLAQRCRRNGRGFVGVGVRGHTSPYLVAASNEFKYYDVLANDANPAPDEDTTAADPARGRDLLVRALDQLLGSSPTGWVKRVQLKPLMLRLDPSFDQREYGHDTFTAFLDAHDPALVEHREVAGSDREYRLTGNDRFGSARSSDRLVATADAVPASPALESRYAVALRATKVVLATERSQLWRELHDLPRLLGGRGFSEPRELEQALARQLDADAAKDVFTAAFRVGRVFRHDTDGYRLREHLTGTDIRRQVALGLADRVRLSEGHHLDETALMTLLFGFGAGDADRALVGEVLRTPTVQSYQGIVSGLLPGGALVALLDAVALASSPRLGPPLALRDRLVAAAERAGFGLSEADGATLWDLLYDAGVLRGDGHDGVERALPPDPAVHLEAVVGVLQRRVADAGIPYDRDVLGAATGLPIGGRPASPVPATTLGASAPLPAR